MALFCKALLRRNDLFCPKTVLCYPIVSAFQIRGYALRKGTRERKEAVARKNKKVAEVKTGYVPKIKNKDLLLLNHVKRKFDDPGKRTPVDDVYTYKYYQWKIYSIADAIQCARETHHPEIYNVPNAPVKIAIHLDFEAEKKTKTFDNFHRMAPMPHGFDHGEQRTVMAFAKTPELQAEAKAAGAALCGDTDLIRRVQSGEVLMADFQYVVAHPQILPELLTLRGLMKRKFPNPKTGTLDVEIGKAVARFINGISYSAIRDPLETDFGTIETSIGTLDMDVKHLEENFASLVQDVNLARPNRPGTFIIRCIMSSPPSKEKLKLIHDIYLSAKETEEEEVVDTGVIDEEIDIGERIWNTRDIAFIGNNYSISKKFDKNTANIENATTINTHLEPIRKLDLAFIGNNYSIAKKFEVPKDIKKSDLNETLPLSEIFTKEGINNIAFIGNNYSVCKKIGSTSSNELNKMALDNMILDKISDNPVAKLEFDIQQVDKQTPADPNNLNESDGMKRFNAWFENTINDQSEHKSIENVINSNDIIYILNTTKIDDVQTTDTSPDPKEAIIDEVSIRNVKTNISDKEVNKFLQVLPLESKCSATSLHGVEPEQLIPDEDVSNNIDITDTEMLVLQESNIGQTRSESNYIDIEHEEPEIFAEVDRSVDSNISDVHFDAVVEPMEANFSSEQQDSATNFDSIIDAANLETLSLKASSYINAKNGGMEITEKVENHVSSITCPPNTSIEIRPENIGIEELQLQLLALKLQATQSMAQIEETILRQKVRITELELKIREFELKSLQQKCTSKISPKE